MTESLAQEILTKIKAARLVVLALHRHPDADSMGAAAAFGALLAQVGVPHLYSCPSAVPEQAQYFGIEARYVLTPQMLARIPADLIATFDAGDPEYVGIGILRHSERSEESLADANTHIRAGSFGLRPQDDNERRTFIVNFDHHATNTRFGNLNVVEPACASTTEIIYELLRALRFPISPRTASYLLAGLLNDTDHFFNPATTASALTMAAELLSRGVTLSALRSLLFEQRAITHLQLIGEILSRLTKNQRYGVAVTYCTAQDAKRYGVDGDELEGMANILNVLGEVKAMVLVKAAEDHISVSMRTTRGDVDLGRLAKLLGGGGHRKAAGFTIKGALTVEEGHVRIV